MRLLTTHQTPENAKDFEFFIMVTAKSQSEDVVDALNRGANDYITKPVDFSIALARVLTQLERKRAEEALRASEAQLQAIVENLDEGVVVCDGVASRQAVAAILISILGSRRISGNSISTNM